jgi:hypothetical protein
MAFRVYSLVFIFILLIGALFAFQYFLSMISSVRPEDGGGRGAPEAVEPRR